MDRPYTKYPRSVLWLLRGGTFTMGGPEPDASPPFEIELPPYYIGTTVITNRQYEAFAPNHRRGPDSPGDDDPATGVSFRDAAGYCAWYARISRKPIRLPSEAEWELACRGGSPGRYPWEDDGAAHAEFAWLAENSGGRVHEAQSLRPNGLGLYGTIGNVWEWTSSLYIPYPVRPGDGRDDLFARGERVLRGGSFRTPVEMAGCSVRRAAAEELALDDVGFRIVREFPGATSRRMADRTKT
ncbi:MAG: formylglycine-generating enzyme family protein [Acidobacteriota bacterium]|nr:formylglycine-generating enzyme family protein [Acidobacteriota bacterium]